MKDPPSFLLGITQEFGDTAGSLAKSKNVEERRSKLRNDPIPLRINSMKKRKANEISDSNVDSGEKEAINSDKSNENDIEEENKVFSPLFLSNFNQMYKYTSFILVFNIMFTIYL